jgi:hypothetical protein
LAKEVARKATVLVEPGDTVPLNLAPDRNVLAIAPRSMGLVLANDPANSHDHLDRAIRRHHENVTCLLVDSEPTEDQCFEAEALLQNAEVVIFGLLDTLPSDGMGKLFEQLVAAEKYPGARVPIVLVSAGTPYVLAELEGYAAAVQVFGYSRPLIAAAVDVLFGKAEAGGSLPVAVGGGGE